MTRYLSFLYGPTISGCHGKAVENVKLYSFLMLFGDIFIISHQRIGQHLSLPPMYWTVRHLSLPPMYWTVRHLSLSSNDIPGNRDIKQSYISIKHLHMFSLFYSVYLYQNNYVSHGIHL